MTHKRRTFTTELKCEAASLMLDKGDSIAEAATLFGLGDTAERRWAQPLKKERNGGTPTSKPLCFKFLVYFYLNLF